MAALVRGTAAIRELAAILGLFLKPPPRAAGEDDGSRELLDGLVGLLIDLRKEARGRKDYATGDAIRDRLAELGIALLDRKDGTHWERKS